MTDTVKDPPSPAVLETGTTAFPNLEPIHIARLLRVARDLNMDATTQEELRIELLEMLDQGTDEGHHGAMDGANSSASAGLPRDLQSDATSLSPEVQSTAQTRQGAAARAAANPSPGARTPHLPDQAALAIKLRQLAQGGADWERLKPLAMDLFAADPTPTTAARTVELAFLHGTSADVAELISRFRVSAWGFYQEIHPGVRVHLAARLYAQELSSADLASLLFACREMDFLHPGERLYVLLSMLRSDDPAHGLMYFRRHEHALLDAAQAMGGAFGITPAWLFLKLGRIAESVRYTTEARDMLERIPPDAPERDEALGLLLKLDGETSQSGASSVAMELEAAAGDLSRLEKLELFLATTRKLAGYKDRNRPGLNAVLQHPLEWFGDQPGMWQKLSHVIVKSRDLEGLLPNIWDLFKANALRWHAPDLEGALWSGPLSLDTDLPFDLFWKGVAKLHRYVQAEGKDHSALWEARELINTHRVNLKSRADAPEWAALHHSAFGWVAKSSHLLEQDRQRMLCELRLASPDTTTSLSDVDDYLSQNSLPPRPITERLIQIARVKKALALEARILVTRGFTSHLTNNDLNRLWLIGCERKDYDLAWRTASVLKARGALARVVHHPWDICGEKRSHYQPLSPTLGHVVYCLSGLSQPVERLAKAILLIGPLLPEILAILDAKSTSVRVSGTPPDSVEAQVDQALRQVEWLPTLRRRIILSHEQAGAGGDIPAFAQVLPANTWSILVLRLSERLGLYAWRWRLSFLAQQVVDVIPRLASRHDLGRRSTKVAKWLRALTPEQRSAWHDVNALSKTMSDEEALFGLAAVVCRIATMIIPNHAQALASLIAMRSPAATIWDQEQFILSPVYSHFRQTLGLTHKVPIPSSLLSLTSIVEPTSTTKQNPWPQSP